MVMPADPAPDADRARRDELVREVRGYLWTIAKAKAPRVGVSIWDLFQSMMVAVLETADGYGSTPGDRPAWFARRAYLRALARVRGKRRREVLISDLPHADRLPFDPAAAPDGEPGDAADRAVLAERVRAAVEKLPERERLVIARRFGLDGGGGATFEQIAGELGTTYQNCSQVAARALGRLRWLLAERGVGQESAVG